MSFSLRNGPSGAFRVSFLIDRHGVLRQTYCQSRIATSTRGGFVTDQNFIE